MPLVTSQGFNMNPDIGGLVQRGVEFGDRYRRRNLEDIQKSRVAQAEAERNRMIQEQLGGAFQQQPTYGAGGGEPPLWGGAQQQPGLGVQPQPPIGGHMQPIQQLGVAQQQGTQGLGQQSAQDPNQGMNQYRQMIQQQTQLEGVTQEQAIRNLFSIDPSLGKKALEGIDLLDKRLNQQTADWAFRMENLPPQRQDEEIRRRAAEIVARGGNPNNTLGLMNLTPENRKFALKNMQVAALTNKERIELAEKAKEKDKQLAGQVKVQSSKLLPGGLVQLVMNDGSVITKQPDEANEALIKAAEERGAELQGLRAGERGAAAESIKIGADSFKQLAGIRQNIANMDEGIKLLDEGAKVGAIEGRLPSIRAASIKLDNLRGRLGLDVIGAATFGALSEGELQFALNTALPKTLDEKELKKWLEDKRSAQHKLAANLEEAALFLSTPGNTVAEFIKMKKAERDAQEQAPKAGRFQIEVIQ